MFLPFHWQRAHHLTFEQLPTNNGLLIRIVVQLGLAANNSLLICKSGNHAFRLLAVALAL